MLKVLRNHKFQQYKIRKVHHLHIGDTERRRNFCQWYIHKTQHNPTFFQNIIWTDEAYISSDGIFNRYNNHYWSDTNSYQTFSTIRQGRFGFHVWVALFNGAVLGYCIIHGNLNTNQYTEVLERNVIDALDNMPLEQRRDVFFQ